MVINDITYPVSNNSSHSVIQNTYLHVDVAVDTKNKKKMLLVT